MNDIDFETITREEKYLATIKEIRSKNFSKNLPFLILSDKLPEGQAYREFSDGHIELQEIFAIGSKYSFKVLKTLTIQEADKIRRENGLL